jgi:hypothetical protein
VVGLLADIAEIHNIVYSLGHCPVSSGELGRGLGGSGKNEMR